MATIIACSRGKNTLKVASSNKRLPMVISNIMPYPIRGVNRCKVNGPTSAVELSSKIVSSVAHWIYLELGGVVEGLSSYILP